MHTFHAFSPDTIEDYEGLSAQEYDALKERRADAIIDRLERACFPGLRDAIVFREARPCSSEALQFSSSHSLRYRSSVTDVDNSCFTKTC
jgi:hypothetical protein